MKKRISDFSSDEQRTILIDICNGIYIARNISLSHADILDELGKIDSLFRTVEYEEEYKEDDE